MSHVGHAGHVGGHGCPHGSDKLFCSSNPGNLVVTYHYVRPENSDGVTALTPEEFDDQLAMIARTHRFVTCEEFVATHASRGGMALVTFDDAVRDQYEYAAELLEARAVPAVFFAPMRPYAQEDFRGINRSPWTTQHLVHALAQEIGWAEFERRVDAILGPVQIDTAEMDRLYHYEVQSKRRLKYTLAFALPEKPVREALQEINARIGLAASDWFMSADELLELQSAGHSLGGHGFDHVPFSTLTPMQQAAEMHRSQMVMAGLFGAMPRALAYPFGRTTAESDVIARGCGYTHGFTTENRVDAKFVGERLAVRAAA